MPPKRKSPHARRRSAGWPRRLLLFSLLVLLILIGCMHLQARTVHVRHASVRLADLPEEFDGTKILYVSDLNLFGTHTPSSAAALLERLKTLQPDMLLLGGDYASPSLLEKLNFRDSDAPQVRERIISARAEALGSLADFAAPLGKYAVAGEADLDAESLRAAMEVGGVNLLSDDVLVLTKGSAKLILAGLKDSGGEMRSLGQIAGRVQKGDCAIVLAHSPHEIAGIQTAEASDGGAWADLVLCGHTRGGQICLGGRSLFALDEYEQRYRHGWFRENGSVLLTSGGAGCRLLNLRLGSSAEVHLITLRRGEPNAGGVSPAETFQPPHPEARWSPGG